VFGGGAADLWLGRGGREGPDCFLDLSERPSPHKPGTYVIFSQSYGSSVIFYTSTVYELI
jgi:hypothetical protein